MSKWEMVRLGDVCSGEITNIAQKNLADNIGNYPIFGASGLIKHVDFYKQDKPYIAVVKDGAGVGRVSYMPTKSSVIGTMQYILPNERINVKFLYYVMVRMKLARFYTGATIPHIYFKDYKKEFIPLPPLPIQQRIADILDHASILIEKRKAQIEKLDLLVKARFVDMFGDPVVDSKSWGIKPLNDSLVGVRYGTGSPPPYSKSGYAFIRATNIKNGRVFDTGMKFITEEDGKKIEKCRLNGGEIIIVRSGVNTGDTCIVPMKYAGHFAGYDIIIETDAEQLNAIFLNELLNTSYMLLVVKPLTARTAQPHINAEQVRSLPIIKVPLELQTRFADFVRQVDKSKSEMQRGLDKLELLYKSLMQKCFKGEMF